MSDRILLEAIADQLYRWAGESRTGGWSTHQVDPMRALAGKIHEHIAEHPASTDVANKAQALLTVVSERFGCLDSDVWIRAELQALREALARESKGGA